MSNLAQPSPRMLKRFDAQGDIVESVFKPEDRFTILDVGTEAGHTGRTLKQRFPKSTITGVEVHPPMLDYCLAANGLFYNSLILSEALEYLRAGHVFDVIVAAEIIEHFPKENGWELLTLLKKHARKLAIVTSPIGFKGQAAIHDNPYERHVSGWDPGEFRDAGWTTHLLDYTGYTLGVYWTRGEAS
jgi:hypothetical protein